MKLVVANLNEEDLVSIAAYVSSRPPVRTVEPEKQLAQLPKTP
jgi:cytochrome c553